MCGILGLVHYSKSAPTYIEARMLRKATTALLKESQSRGFDATGLIIVTDKQAAMFKNDVPANKFITTTEYSNVLKTLNRSNRFRTMLGHVRQKTKGHQRFNINNHPIVANRIVGVHNGIIANDDYLFDKYAAHIDRSGEVDSEIIFRLIDFHRSEGETLAESVKLTCEDITGTYVCAFVDLEDPDYLTLFTNKGNLDILIYDQIKVIAFASSEFILTKALHDNSALDPMFSTHHVEMWHNGLRINTQTGKIFEFELGKKKLPSIQPSIHQRGGCSLEGITGQYIDDCDHLCNNCPYYNVKKGELNKCT